MNSSEPRSDGSVSLHDDTSRYVNITTTTSNTINAPNSHHYNEDPHVTLNNALATLNSLHADPVFGLLPSVQYNNSHNNNHNKNARQQVMRPRHQSPNSTRGQSPSPPIRYDVTRTPRDDVWRRLYKQNTEAQHTTRMSDQVLREWREQKDLERQAQDLTFRPSISALATAKAQRTSTKNLVQYLTRPVREQRKYDEQRVANEMVECTFRPKITQLNTNTVNLAEEGGETHKKTGFDIADRLFKDSCDRRKRLDEKRAAALKAEDAMIEQAKKNVLTPRKGAARTTTPSRRY
eukprot:PhF_6_TR22246/c0_g1_i2/m.31421